MTPELRLPPTGLIASVLLPALVAGVLTAALTSPGSEPQLPTGPAPAPRLLPVRSLEPLAEGQRPVSSLSQVPRLEALEGGIRPALPASIAIPAAGARGPVDPIRTVRGRFEVPQAGRAGWYVGGPRPGETGRALIISHVDSGAGPALFARLRELHRGAAIQVDDRSGRNHRFRVTRTRQIAKTRFPADAVYRPVSSRELVLITCGGPFTPGVGYRDNVILYARAA